MRSLSELEEHSLEQLTLVGDRLLLVELLKWIDDSLDVLTVELDRIEEIQDLVEGTVWQHEHVLGERLDQTQEAPLGVEPSVRAELLLERLQTLHDTRHTEVVVALGAVKSANDQVDDAKVEDLLVGLFDGNALLFFLNTFHQLFSIRVLAGHDVGDAEVGEHDGRDRKQVVHLAADERLVVADGVAVLVVLHEEDVGHVQLPRLVFAAELGRLAEDLLHHGVVVVVPVDLGLHHEDGNVLVERQVVLLERVVNGL